VGTAEKVLQLQPENPAVMDTLGWILVQAGELEKGMPLLKRASSLSPKSPDIRFHYASGLAKAGDTLNAKEELERLLMDFPKFSQNDEVMKLLSELRKG